MTGEEDCLMKQVINYKKEEDTLQCRGEGARSEDGTGCKPRPRCIRNITQMLDLLHLRLDFVLLHGITIM